MERLAATGRPVPARELAQFRADWQKAVAIPGVVPAVWQQAALDQAQRLQALIPQLPSGLQDDARDIVALLVGLAGREALPPTPTAPVAPGPTSPPPPRAFRMPEKMAGWLAAREAARGFLTKLLRESEYFISIRGCLIRTHS